MFQTLQKSSSNITEEEIKQVLDAIGKEKNGDKALEILNTISYLVPKNIHTKMLLGLADNEEELRAAIELLKQYSIVHLCQEETVLNINKLVQKIIRINLKKQKKEEEILKGALGLLFGSSNLDHAIFVWDYASEYQELVKESSGLPSHIVNWLIKHIRYEEANIFGWKALDLLKRTMTQYL